MAFDHHHHHLPHSTTPSTTPSITTIEYLPNHVLSEVSAKVGSSSLGKLYERKSCSKNFNNLIEEDDYIYKHINMHKIRFIPWNLKPQESSFLAHCKECRNPESLYRDRMAKFSCFKPDIMDLGSGLEMLKEASLQGHVEARYVCGMILLCSEVEEQRKQGFEFLSFFLGKLRCMRTVRNKVREDLNIIWKNLIVRTMFKDHHRLCGFNMCLGLQEIARLEKGWPVLDDDEDGLSLISCELCRWDYELHKFSKICC